MVWQLRIGFLADWDSQKIISFLQPCGCLNQIELVALAKKMVKPDTKTVTLKISIPKTKVIKQPAQQTSKPAAKDAIGTAIKPITTQKPLTNQQYS